MYLICIILHNEAVNLFCRIEMEKIPKEGKAVDKKGATALFVESE
jgi:hypothetical protein